MKNNLECCREWIPIIAFVVIVWLAAMIFPGKFGVILALLTTPIGLGIVSALAIAIAKRKAQVLSWERDRPFNDGDDDTPDPYLFNPGPGGSWGLRAFMPDVYSYSFWKSPCSWVFKQAKRKVAVLLDDGTVSFPIFPVEWISETAGSGSRIPVPHGWKITADQAEVLQKKRDFIKKNQRHLRTEYQHDFMLFTDLIFDRAAKIGRKESRGEVDVISQLNSRVDFIDSSLQQNMVVIMRNFSSFFGEIKELLAFSERLAEWEKKRPVEIGKLKNRVAGLERVVAPKKK